MFLIHTCNKLLTLRVNSIRNRVISPTILRAVQSSALSHNRCCGLWPLITALVWSKVSPQIYVSPRNKSVPEGHPENFSCKATGVPKPTFSWKFNDGYLPSGISQASLSEGSFLELPYTTKRMEGIYKCTAENKANTTTSSAYLHVFGKQKKNLPHTISLIVGTKLCVLNSCKNTFWRNSGANGNWTYDL